MAIQFPLLTADQIEVKVKQIGKPSGSGVGAVTLLLYKTARTDMDILDAVVGPLKWQKDYKEIKGNLYCGIGVYDEEFQDWVWKWDCGTESRSDGDGNEKKGEASDAAKRAGFCVGIGRELYTGPRITAFLPVEIGDNKKPALKEKHHRFDGFRVGEIMYEERSISRLSIVDSKGAVIYAWDKARGNVTPRQPAGQWATAQDATQPRADNARPSQDNIGGNVVICERCRNPVKGFRQNGNTYRVSDVLAWSNAEYGKNYCYRCYVELRDAQNKVS